MQVRDIMTSDARIIGPDTMVREAARAMRAGNVGALPVGENDRLIGMVTDRDIVVRAVADELPPGDTTVRDVMSRGICYVFDDDDLAQAAQVMAKHQVRRLPVVNRDKRLVGMLALADLGRSDAEASRKALSAVSEPSDRPRR